MKHDTSLKEKIYTSTGEKLLYHSQVMKKFNETGFATPITLHVMPTSKCNLHCNFCSVKNRETHEILDLENVVIPTIETLYDLGLKSVILSGGGEPMMYPPFEDLIKYLKFKGLEIGMITNGTLLKKNPDYFYNNFTWIRISINSLENGGNVHLPKVKNTTLGFSYITNPLTSLEKLKDIQELAKKNNVEYIRLLPDCAQDFAKLEDGHEKVDALVKSLGDPFFHQYKIPKTPNKCYLGFFHPVLYCDGKIYPCDSLVLNDHQNQQFKKDFALCDWNQVGSLYSKQVYSLVDTKKMCPNCVFERQNTLLEKILNGKIDSLEEGEIKHKNFI